MMKIIKRILSVVLMMALVLSFCVCPSVCADGAGEELSKLTVKSIVDSAKCYHNASSGTKYETATPAFDDAFNTYVQWDASTSTNGTTLKISLETLSRVRKIDIYIGADGSWNESRRNSKYTSVPVSGVGFSDGSGWGIETTKASAGNYLNGTGELPSAVYARNDIKSAQTADDLDVISIDVDSVCDELSLLLSATGGKYANGSWTDANNTTRMAVAEIVVWGEELTDVLRDENGTAICTVETSTRSVRFDECEEYLLNDDSGLTGVNIKRWRAERPDENTDAIELIFRLDGIYEISAFRANEYWQSKNQTDTTFSDVAFYIGNTDGATTKWDLIVDGVTFNSSTVAGHSRNVICDASGTSYTGDSFKMVVNGTDFSDENSSYSASISLTDVGLYGNKTDETLLGTTMKKCEFVSTVDGEQYSIVATTADSIEFTADYNGTEPSVVICAAYSANNELIGVGVGQPGETIVINNEEGQNVYYIKVFGWNGIDDIVPVSTTYTRYAAQYLE